jgi:hypothetical protein
MSVTKADILATIKAETGDPSTGPVCDATPAIADAIDRLLNPQPKVERAVAKGAAETR